MTRANAAAGSSAPARDAPASAQDPWVPLPPLQIESWEGPLLAAFRLFSPQALWIASTVGPLTVAHLGLYKVQDDFDGFTEVGIGHNRRRISQVRTAIATRVERWVGGNPLRWQHPATGEDRPDHLEPKGFWPVRLGTDSHPNRITPNLPKSPTEEWVLRKRIWALGDGYGATVVQEIATAAIAEEVARMPNRTALREPYLDGGWVFHQEREEGGRYLFEQRYVLPEAKKRGIKVWTEAGLKHFLGAAMQRSKAEYKGQARVYFRQVCAAMLKEEREAPALQPRQTTALGEPLRPAYTVTSSAAASARGYSVRRTVYEPDLARQIEAKLREKGRG